MIVKATVSQNAIEGVAVKPLVIRADISGGTKIDNFIMSLSRSARADAANKAEAVKIVALNQTTDKTYWADRIKLAVQTANALTSTAARLEIEFTSDAASVL